VRATRNIALTALLLLVLAGAAAGTGLDAAEVTVGTGTASHPLGFADDDDAAYLFQSALLAAVFGSETAPWRLVYEGTAYQFAEEAPLDQMRHALGVERIGSLGGGAVATRMGAQVEGRFHLDPLYEMYDYRQAGAYVAAKGWPTVGLLVRGEAEATLRGYPELPEESWVEANAGIEAQRFFASKTTLGARVDWSGKWFVDPEADRVWGDGAAAAQARVRLQAAQGLGERLGLRTSATVRFTLRDFPYVVREDLYDSPLLDAYASAGWQGVLAARALAPWQTWVEVGGSTGEQDYGEILFSGDEGPATRRDELSSVFGSLERTFPVGGRSRLLATLQGGWFRQSSNLARYDLSGVNVVTSLRWSW
jgi:hypothetical protein